jgi:hypothetical protein
MQRLGKAAPCVRPFAQLGLFVFGPRIVFLLTAPLCGGKIMSFREKSNPIRPGAASLPSASTREVVEMAETGLRKSPYLALSKISCEFHDGILTLRGCLPRYYLKQIAQEVVAVVPGVEHVANQIEIVARK